MMNRDKTVRKPELLAPAGNLEKLKMAVIYGADAVYLGEKNMASGLMPAIFPTGNSGKGSLLPMPAAGKSISR